MLDVDGILLVQELRPHPVSLIVRIALTGLLVALLAMAAARASPMQFREYWKRLVLIL
jgi:hypothetical protein